MRCDVTNTSISIKVLMKFENDETDGCPWKSFKTRFHLFPLSRFVRLLGVRTVTSRFSSSVAFIVWCFLSPVTIFHLFQINNKTWENASKNPSIDRSFVYYFFQAHCHR